MKPDDVKTKSEELNLKETDSADSIGSEEVEQSSSPESSAFNHIRLSDHYEVQQLVGRGGMGAVYRVLDKTTNKIVAIKLMQSDVAKDQSAFKRFEQEVEAASSLSHDNLVSVYGHGKAEDGAPYLVMDYFEGESLSDIVKKEGALQAVRSLNLFLQIGEGLKHAHENKIIHRDIKPTNIIVSKNDDGSERARVVDFGIARVLPTNTRDTRSLTETGEVFGSPHYMSPEHCLGFMMDNKSDIYSFGCLMYEVLTGAPPFVADNPIQIVVKHINVEPSPFPANITRDITTRRLESVVMRCLEKDVETRYQSMEELLKDLRSIKEGKDPSKFSPRKKPKAEFTRQQIIISSVGLVIVGVYLLFGLILTGSGTFQNAIFVGITNLITWGGSFAFIKACVDRYKSIRAGKNEVGSWWTFLLLLSLAGVCTTAAPLAFYGSLNVLFHFKSDFVNVYMIRPLCYMQFAAATSLFLSTIGWILFHWQKGRNGGIKVAIQYICLVAVIAVSTLTLFRPFASQMSYQVGIQIRNDMPAVGKFLLSSAIELDPNNIRAQEDAIQDLYNSGKYDDVIAACTDRLDKIKGDKVNRSPYFKLRASAYQAKGLPRMAIVDWTAAINTTQNDGTSYENRAAQKVLLRDYQGALQDYELAVRYSPYSSDASREKAALHAALGQYSQAERELTIATSKDSPDTDLIFLKALVHRQMGFEDRVKQDFEELLRDIQEDPLNVNARDAIYAAYAATELGKTDLAKQFIAQAKDHGMEPSDLNRDPMIVDSKIPFKWEESSVQH